MVFSRILCIFLLRLMGVLEVVFVLFVMFILICFSVILLVMRMVVFSFVLYVCWMLYVGVCLVSVVESIVLCVRLKLCVCLMIVLVMILFSCWLWRLKWLIRFCSVVVSICWFDVVVYVVFEWVNGMWLFLRMVMWCICVLMSMDLVFCVFLLCLW